MAYSITIKVLLPALGLAGVIACGGSDQNTPPKTPDSNTPSVTGATQAGPSSPASSPQTTSGQDLSSTADTQASAPPTTTPSNTNLMPSGGSTGSTATTGSSGNTPDTLNDSQIAAVAEAANKGEVEQAKVALKKSKNARVRQFAEHMVTDHTAAMNDQKTIDQKNNITPQDSDASNGIKSNGEQVMTQLSSSNGDAFDKAYIDAQVDEHQKVLDMLDNKLIPLAQNADLKAMLQKVRAKVAGHLKMAQDIQSSLSH